MNFPKRVAGIVFLVMTMSPAFSQGAQVAFGDLNADITQPVEVSADQLIIDQSNGTAVFSGNVVIGQGAMRISADKVRVEYGATGGENAGEISKLLADGHVILVNGDAVAESNQAIYTIETGSIIMTGDVIVTQGTSALSSESMVVDLGSGVATMEGRVRTVLRSGGN